MAAGKALEDHPGITREILLSGCKMCQLSRSVQAWTEMSGDRG